MYDVLPVPSDAMTWCTVAERSSGVESGFNLAVGTINLIWFIVSIRPIKHDVIRQPSCMYALHLCTWGYGCYIMLCHAMPCNVYAIFCYVLLCCIMSCHVKCHLMLCHVYFMSCHVISCYVKYTHVCVYCIHLWRCSFEAVGHAGTSMWGMPKCWSRLSTAQMVDSIDGWSYGAALTTYPICRGLSWHGHLNMDQCFTWEGSPSPMVDSRLYSITKFRQMHLVSAEGLVAARINIKREPPTPKEEHQETFFVM